MATAEVQKAEQEKENTQVPVLTRVNIGFVSKPFPYVVCLTKLEDPMAGTPGCDANGSCLE